MVDLTGNLIEIYNRLYEAYGPQNWWPADTPLEVMVGAVLTQNTSWRGAAQAVANLKREGVLGIADLQALDSGKLAELIRPAGYFNVKARRLKNLIGFAAEAFNGDLKAVSRLSTSELREQLLGVHGVGPETADSILLYAFQRPIFVVDAYTRRVMSRHGLIHQAAGYDLLQQLFMEHLAHDASLFNEYHALLVRVGKERCKRKPRCRGCPLEPTLGG